MDDLSPESKPAFLDPARAEAIGYVGALPDAVPSFDHEIAPLPELMTDSEARGKGASRGYEVRWDEIARLHALGYTNNQIARHLGYSATGISLALNKPFTQAAVEKWRKAVFDHDTISRLKEAARDGAARIHGLILDPKTKDTVLLDAAKFAVEKSHGKARQEVNVESGTFTNFMELLRQVHNRNEPLDVTPHQTATHEEDAAKSPEANKWKAWLTTNL